MFDTQLRQFNSIIGERTAARLELDRILIRGHVPERYQAVETYMKALDKCVAELEVWTETMRDRVEYAYRNNVGAPSTEDPAWMLIKATGVGSWINSLRQERDVLASELAAIDELNRESHDLSVSDNGSH